MVLKCTVIIVLLSTTTLSQYMSDTGMRPDVTFGESNERFDVSSMIIEQNRLLDEVHDDYRRHSERRIKSSGESEDNESMNTLKHILSSLRRTGEGFERESKASDEPIESDTPNKLKDTISSLRRTNFGLDDFAYHDNMNSEDGGTVMDYEKKLETFVPKNARRGLENIVDYLHKGQTDIPKRRSGIQPDPEDEVLLHYAVPIDMKVYGYLQPQLDT